MPAKWFLVAPSNIRNVSRLQCGTPGSIPGTQTAENSENSRTYVVQGSALELCQTGNVGLIDKASWGVKLFLTMGYKIVSGSSTIFWGGIQYHNIATVDDQFKVILMTHIPHFVRQNKETIMQVTEELSTPYSLKQYQSFHEFPVQHYSLDKPRRDADEDCRPQCCGKSPISSPFQIIPLHHNCTDVATKSDAAIVAVRGAGHRG
ncbi:hypothetical protein J6590_036464, partial [Homalodisca vitripennis]